MKHYQFEIYVDFPKENHIDMSQRLHGYANIPAETLRESLYTLCNMVFDSLQRKDVLIGLKHVGCTCNGKNISESYRNTMIFNDDALKKYMWC